jgi:ABC-type Fe3+/spermidine/putrescine transport system ATPase subunit
MSIHLKNITKSFGGRTILNDLVLKVKKGEFHVILGPSGEGKSSLLAIIAGLLKPDRGEVWIGNRQATSLPPRKRSVGFVFQDFALFPHLTVFDNIAYGLKAIGLKNSLIKERVSRHLHLVGMSDYRDKYPATLSGGEKQRVALARALVIEPEVLLLDEPLSHLDMSLKEELTDELKCIQRESGVTALYVTHDKTEAMTLANRVSVLHRGCIEQVEEPGTVFFQPKTPFVASFVGSKNILNVRLVALKTSTAIFEIVHPELREKLHIEVKRYPVFTRKKELSLCLHPEKIELCQEVKQANCFAGQMIKVDSRGALFEVTVDVAGLILTASIPRTGSMDLTGGILISFPPDAFHPLCGRCHSLPEYLRDFECLKHFADR